MSAQLEMLHRAVRLGDLDEAKLAISLGVDVNAGVRGDAALHLISAEKGELGTELLKLLIASGAVVDAGDDHGTTLLMKLASWDPKRKRTLLAAQLLLDAGADPSARDEIGKTALHHAASANDAALVELLLARGANAHARSWPHLHERATTALDATESPAIAQQLRDAMARTQAPPEPTHGTTLAAMLPRIEPYLGAKCRIGREDALGHLQDEGREYRLAFFASLEAGIRRQLHAKFCKRFTDTMIPFAVVGSKRLHARGVTIDADASRDGRGVVFWELALGSGDRCPCWYWAVPGNVHDLTRVGSSLDALGIEVL